MLGDWWNTPPSQRQFFSAYRREILRLDGDWRAARWQVKIVRMHRLRRRSPKSGPGLWLSWLEKAPKSKSGLPPRILRWPSEVGGRRQRCSACRQRGEGVQQCQAMFSTLWKFTTTVWVVSPPSVCSPLDFAELPCTEHSKAQNNMATGPRYVVEQQHQRGRVISSLFILRHRLLSDRTCLLLQRT